MAGMDTPPNRRYLHIVLPGEPPPGARPRATMAPTMSTSELLRRARSARTVRELMVLFRSKVHPARKVEKWTKAAELQLIAARQAHWGSSPVVPKGQPVEVFILCVFELPKSKWRQRKPPRRAWQVSHGAGDWDNLGKPVCDAANEVLWHDDCQVVRGVVEKIVGRQGEPGRLEILVRPMEALPHVTMFEEVLAETTGVPTGRSSLFEVT